jgi:hypothetical protein
MIVKTLMKTVSAKDHRRTEWPHNSTGTGGTKSAVWNPLDNEWTVIWTSSNCLGAPMLKSGRSGCRSYISAFAACHSCNGLLFRTKRNSMGAIKNWKHSNSMDSPNRSRKSRLTVQPNGSHNFSIMAGSVILGKHDGESVTISVDP